MPQTHEGAPRAQAPAWWQTAQRLYHDTFGAKDSRELAAVMADWQELGDDERLFYLCHLQYLNLQAQLGLTRLLTDVREQLEEHGELLEQFQDLPPEAGDAESESDEDDGWIEPTRTATEPIIVKPEEIELIIPDAEEE